MHTHIFINHHIIEASQAHIDVNDRGLLLGDGLFETLRICQGKVPFIEQHWERLKRGCQTLHLPLFLTLNKLHCITQKLIEKNQLQHIDGSIRITMTRGVGARGLTMPTHPKPTVMISTSDIPTYPESLKLFVSKYSRNELSPLSQIKTTNYLENILARQEARSNGADDAIMINTKGNVACTSCANIFAVHNQKLYTPKLSDGALPGIMRAHIISLANQINIPTIEKSLVIDDLYNADEVFLTNSLMLMKPVAKINHRDMQLESRSLMMRTIFSVLKKRRHC